MTASPNPYDELPYQSFPIEWTAPERLALASLLHGGPRPLLDGYRVLELGCGSGANLLALAYYRQHVTFLGVILLLQHADPPGAPKERIRLCVYPALTYASCAGSLNVFDIRP